MLQRVSIVVRVIYTSRLYAMLRKLQTDFKKASAGRRQSSDFASPNLGVLAQISKRDFRTQKVSTLPTPQ